MSVSHPVAVSVFIICRDVCACTEMPWMCVEADMVELEIDRDDVHDRKK